MAEDQRPEWAERMRRQRFARGWSQNDLVRAMRAYSAAPLPSDLVDQLKRWERGRNKPNEFYRRILAAAFGTVTESLFRHEYADKELLSYASRDQQLISATGMDTIEILQRIRGSSINDRTLQALEITIEQLCCDYAPMDASELITTSRDWLSRITALLEGRLTLKQHRDMLSHAGMLALLVGCLEYDIGDYRSADATRRMALELGSEAENSNIIGWALEMQAWFALTNGNYRAVLAAAQAGQDATRAPNRSVTVQLLAQEAKAWARMGSRRNVMHALEKGRTLLDSLPYPSRPENHFVIDPNKFDFYCMDCYRIVGEDRLAELSAEEVLTKTIRPDGAVMSPMRNSEARITLGVVAARRGEAEAAAHHGTAALQNTRQSRPSLIMVGAELDRALSANDSNAGEDFHMLFTQLVHTHPSP